MSEKKTHKGSFPLKEATRVATFIVSQISPYCDKIEVCGSIRRRRPIVRDIDIIVSDPKPEFMTHLLSLGNPVVIGSKKVSIIVSDSVLGEVGVDVSVVESSGWGAAMMHTTGPVEENIRLRAVAKRQGMLLNQYGLFRNGQFVAGTTEQEVYSALGVLFVEPKNRDYRW